MRAEGKIKITSSSFLLMIFVLLDSGCRYDSIEKVTPVPGNTFPNKIGNTWIYEVDDTTFSWDKYYPDTLITHMHYTVTVTIIDSVIFHGKKGTIWAYNSPVWIDTNYVFRNYDTLHFYDINYSEFPAMDRQYILPLAPQKSWDYVNYWEMGHFHPYPNTTVVVVEVLNNFLLGQSNYGKTFHLTGSLYPVLDDQFTIEEWVSVGIGLTKRRFASHYAKIWFQKNITWSLVYYKIQP